LPSQLRVSSGFFRFGTTGFPIIPIIPIISRLGHRNYLKELNEDKTFLFIIKIELKKE
jgi:hypothetical protein